MPLSVILTLKTFSKLVCAIVNVSRTLNNQNKFTRYASENITQNCANLSGWADTFSICSTLQ